MPAISRELDSTLQRAKTFAVTRGAGQVFEAHLLASLVYDPVASTVLDLFGFSATKSPKLVDNLLGSVSRGSVEKRDFDKTGFSHQITQMISFAQRRAKQLGRSEATGADILFALVAMSYGPTRDLLGRLGIDREMFITHLDQNDNLIHPVEQGRNRPFRGADQAGALDDAEDTFRTLPPALDAVAIEPFVPQQRSAPVRIGARDGRIARVSDRDSTLDTSEADFDRWRDAVLDYIGELTAAEGAFPKGTNHRQVRTRLEALDRLLRGSVEGVKEDQFRIGQDILRLGGVIESYQHDADDLPDMSGATLRDLRLLQAQLILGIGKFGNWADFQRDAAAAPPRGEIIRAAAAETLDVTVATLTESGTREAVDPELPATFRWIRDGLDDPWEATREVVFGAVRSFENLVVFLARTVINTAKGTVTIAAGAISDQLASELLNRLAETARELSAALPNGWTWLQPLLDIIGKLHGWY